MGNMTDEDATAAKGRAPAGRPASKVPMRERIVEAATALFYAQGLRAVSAEKIIAQVGITKVTFYRHFPTKADLIVAYLERRAKWERDAIAHARQAAGDVPDVFRIIAQAIGAESCSPGFRGCPFINAAAEYTNPDHPVRQTVAVHRRWFKAVLEEMITPLGLSEPASTADQLVLLRDGAMVSGYLGDPATVSRSLHRAARAVISSRT